MSAEHTLAALLSSGIDRLRNNSRSPALDAGLLLAFALGIPAVRLKSHPEEHADPVRAQRYLGLLERRAHGEPLAYLMGEREFWSLPLAVSADVLVPRPETELLVERALALGAPGVLRVADLGTGSGAIALALAHERPAWRITATDVSAPALQIARSNAGRLGLAAVEFRLGSWFEPLAGERFDLLLSNPPYVAADDPAMSTPELGHEPRLALTPGTDALACLRTLARGAPAHLVPGGWLLLEHGSGQGEAVRHALVLAGFRHVRSHRDLGGHERMTEGQHGQI
jgi:release factor glutamine methyltransferase